MGIGMQSSEMAWRNKYVSSYKGLMILKSLTTSFSLLSNSRLRGTDSSAKCVLVVR